MTNDGGVTARRRISKSTKDTHSMAKQKIRPLEDRVVIQQIEAEEKTAGGIVLPDTAKEKPQRGKVLAVGPGKLLDSGERAADRRGRGGRGPLRQVLGHGNQGGRRGDQDPPRVRHPGEDRQVIPPRAGSHRCIGPGVPWLAAPSFIVFEEHTSVAKQLLFSDAARRKMLEGVDILAHAVGTTLGPTGRNVILSKSFGGPTVTKDGVTVSKEIELADPFENMGAKLVNVVASKTSDVAGDGTTTATILARAIYREGLKNITAGRQPHGRPPRNRKGRRGRRGRADDKISRPVSKKEEIAQVGTISANNDPTIGKMLADAVERVGRDGVITVEEGKTADHDPRVRRGDAVRQGLPEPLFRHQPDDDGSRLRGRADPAPREEDQQPPRDGPAPGEGRPVGQAALDRRRGRRGRSAGDPGRQQAARRAEHLPRSRPRGSATAARRCSATWPS